MLFVAMGSRPAAAATVAQAMYAEGMLQHHVPSLFSYCQPRVNMFESN